MPIVHMVMSHDDTSQSYYLGYYSLPTLCQAMVQNPDMNLQTFLIPRGVASTSVAQDDPSLLPGTAMLCPLAEHAPFHSLHVPTSPLFSGEHRLPSQSPGRLCRLFPLETLYKPLSGIGE